MTYEISFCSLIFTYYFLIKFQVIIMFRYVSNFNKINVIKRLFYFIETMTTIIASISIFYNKKLKFYFLNYIKQNK